MKTAYITGATGFIGSTLTNLLLKKGYKVVALGRRSFKEIKLERLPKNKNLLYLKIPLDEISKLPDVMKNYPEFDNEKSIFFHFAWGGVNGLSDFNVEAQLKNVFWSLDSYIASVKLKSKKFIFVGTMEEFFTEKYLNLDYKKHSFFNRHVVYSLAKTAARNYLKMISPEYDTDLVFATNSHVMGPKDDRDSFLQVSLKKLIRGDKLSLTSCDQYFDVISSFDCARAYYLLGEMGVGGKNYWIGSGFPRLLREYVEIMASCFPNSKPLKFGEMDFDDIGLEKSQFSISQIENDTGFKPSMTYQDIVKDLKKYLISQK